MSFADSMYEQQKLALTDDYDDAGFKNEIVALPDSLIIRLYIWSYCLLDVVYNSKVLLMMKEPDIVRDGI